MGYPRYSYPELPRGVRGSYMRQAKEPKLHTIDIPSFWDRRVICRRRPVMDIWKRVGGTRCFACKRRFRQNIQYRYWSMYVFFIVQSILVNEYLHVQLYPSLRMGVSLMPFWELLVVSTMLCQLEVWVFFCSSSHTDHFTGVLPVVIKSTIHAG